MGSRGEDFPFNTDYETVAASQTAQAMGPTGRQGDILERVVIVPATLSPGSVQIKDGSDGAITIFLGGAASLTTLTTIVVELGVRSRVGAWQITTGANVSAIGTGRFT